jgi:hypothetical protein
MSQFEVRADGALVLTTYPLRDALKAIRQFYIASRGRQKATRLRCGEDAFYGLVAMAGPDLMRTDVGEYHLNGCVLEVDPHLSPMDYEADRPTRVN